MYSIERQDGFAKRNDSRALALKRALGFLRQDYPLYLFSTTYSGSAPHHRDNMQQDQATRLLSIDFSYIARYDAAGQRVSQWQHPAASWMLTFAPRACDDHAFQAVVSQRVSGGQIAREITRDAFASIITILVPLPAGGFVIAAANQIVTDQVAGQLADALTAAVVREFAPSYAPFVAAAIVCVALAVLIIALRRMQ
jgi:hypothetical protein